MNPIITTEVANAMHADRLREAAARRRRIAHRGGVSRPQMWLACRLIALAARLGRPSARQRTIAAAGCGCN